jgi:transposase
LTIGRDGWQLLSVVDHADTPRWVCEVPAVAILRRVWMQNYWWDGTQLHWRDADNIPPAAPCLSSPYDVDAHYARKPSTQGVGYKLHSTETCEDDLPHLITHVETMSGPTADGTAMPKIHAALQQRGALPGTPIVDAGFLDAARLVESQDFDGVDLLGPTRQDYHWQTREGAGFDAQHFQIDGDQQHATCPAGKVSTGWTPALETRGNPVIQVKFATTDGRHCEP